MWFKNLYLLRLAESFAIEAETLQAALASKPFLGCGKEQREANGWVSPFGRHSEQLLHAVNGYYLLTMAQQERLLPSTVIREELEERVAALETKESRKLSKREKKDLREQIEFELLPQAFTRTRKMDAWLDPAQHWMVINTSSASQAERLTKLLRTSVDSLPVTPPKTDNPPSGLMTQWLKQNELPAPFILGEECELRSQGDDKSIAVFKRHELSTEEVHSNLAAGKVVSKLGLIWDNKISFVLTDELQLRRVKFLDVLEDNLKEIDPQSAEERLDIEFSLMTGEVTKLLTDLMHCFTTPSVKPVQ